VRIQYDPMQQGARPIESILTPTFAPHFVRRTNDDLRFRGSFIVCQTGPAIALGEGEVSARPSTRGAPGDPGLLRAPDDGAAVRFGAGRRRRPLAHAMSLCCVMIRSP
jgi:hypothetical protein